MWGYPTKGRGKNIETLLQEDNFMSLVRIIKYYRRNNISTDRLMEDIKSTQGLGLSTMSKFTQFLDTTINGDKAVILDIQILNVIRSGRFEEFEDLKGVGYSNAIKRYPQYIEKVNRLAQLTNTVPDQIELFLFTFGKNLSEIND